MTELDAPPDLAALIDAHRAATTMAERIAAHYALLRWPGWKEQFPRPVYHHRGVRVARIWGSLKMDESHAYRTDG